MGYATAIGLALFGIMAICWRWYIYRQGYKKGRADQREDDDRETLAWKNDFIKRHGSGYPGFDVVQPYGKWGSQTSDTGTRVESGHDDAT